MRGTWPTGACARAGRALLVLALLGPSPASAQEAAPPEPAHYDVLYRARLVPTEGTAYVTIRLGQGSQEVLSMRFHIDPERHVDFEGQGGLAIGPETVEWKPAGPGSSLRYLFRIDHLRDERSYDARFAENWALFRGDDLVPPVRVRTETLSEADARLVLQVPEGWSTVVPYPRAADGSFEIENPDRRFDRPTGWMLVGRLGVVREKVAGVRVTIAAPVRQNFRRLDILALLRWTLPELRDALVELPERLLIVGAHDPMWRGGLSGPSSLYLHSGRPLIEPDGTSPPLHELMHSVMRLRAAPGDDWIVEGLAEYYSLQMLVRSHTMSRRRYERVLARLVERGNEADTLVTSRASGAVTARAVGVFSGLDGAIREGSEGVHGLDDVVRVLIARGDEVDASTLRAESERLGGGRSLAQFFRRQVPGVSTEPPSSATGGSR